VTATARTAGSQDLSRRQFIVTSLTATGGFALGIAALPGVGQAATLDVRPWGDEAAHSGEINAWIVIEPDDTVIIRYSRAEMGQGSFTALPMIVTEELECDWAKVKAEYASANRNFRKNESLWEPRHRRQPRGAGEPRHAAAGRRERARTADRRGGQAVGRGARRMRGGDEPGDAQRLRPHATLW
jgi:CO/xanthine dehydrogenase Mo-binding subunit